MTDSEKARIIDAIEEVQWWHMIDDGRIMPGAENHEKALCRYVDVYDAMYAKKEQAEVSLLLLTRLIIADLKELRSHIVTRPCAHLITKLIKKYEKKWEEEN